MRPLFILFGLLASTSAFAEIRLINGTGQELTIDVLHAEKQERDIKLSTDKTISKVYGVPLERNKSEEMVVVRDASGKELIREALQTDGIYAINNWGSGLIFNYSGRFKGASSNGSGMLFINATGKPLNYSTELADFSVRKGKGREPRDLTQITFDDIPNIGKEGDKRTVELSVVGSDVLKTEIVVGTLYFITKDDKTLKVEAVR